MIGIDPQVVLVLLDEFDESRNGGSFDGGHEHFGVAGQRVDDVDNIVEGLKAVESVDIIDEFGEVEHDRHEGLLDLLGLRGVPLLVHVEHQRDVRRQLLIEILQDRDQLLVVVGVVLVIALVVLVHLRNWILS